MFQYVIADQEARMSWKSPSLSRRDKSVQRLK